MKLSLNWLGDFVDLTGIPVEKLVERLTMAVCEVDHCRAVYSHLNDVIAAKVLEVKPHPDADRLRLVQVDAGGGKKLAIVCGAPNVKEGMIVPLAQIGCVLPVSDTESMTIKEAKIRGVTSLGMLCSAQELGLEKLTGETDGLLSLEGASPENIKPGRPLSKIFPLTDTVLDIDNKSITHRPDLWCHFGFAREIAAIFGKKIKFDPTKTAAPKSDPKLPAKKIEIEKGCAHAYYGMYCSNVSVSPGPLWLRARLINVGQKPINNIVDASNYTMLEMGQPNHTFDAGVLKEKIIAVAKNGGKRKVKSFMTLDEIERPVPDGTVLIYDGKGPSAEVVALGGIMGGMKSGISGRTDSLFLESATFPRELIRRALSSLQLRTDSAVRFEKGQDPSKAKPALFRLVQLIKESCPDMKTGALTGEGAKEYRSKISVTLSFLRTRLGFEIPAALVKKILGSLGFIVRQTGGAANPKFSITAPSWRSQYDVTIPEDIVEELGRIYGYDNIKPIAPLMEAKAGPFNRERSFERCVKSHLAESGSYTETYNYSFVSEKDNEIFGDKGLGLKNPLASGQNRLRLSVVPGLLRQAASNQDRFQTVRLFEMGRVYWKDPLKKPEELAREEKRLSIVSIPRPGENEEDTVESFVDFRAVLEKFFLELLNFPAVLVMTAELEDPREQLVQKFTLRNSYPFLHPGCALEIFLDKENIGMAGMINPSFAKRFDLKRDVFVADISFDRFFAVYDRKRKDYRYSIPSIFPDSRFELSLVMDETAHTHLPVNVIRGLNIKEIKDISLINIYRGDPLPGDKKSVSYSIECGIADGTLTGERLQKILESCVAALAKKGFILR